MNSIQNLNRFYLLNRWSLLSIWRAVLRRLVSPSPTGGRPTGQLGQWLDSQVAKPGNGGGQAQQGAAELG